MSLKQNSDGHIEKGLSDEEFSEIHGLIKRIPKEYFQTDFNVLKKVVEMQSSPSKAKEVQYLEDTLNTIEHALYKIIDVYYSGFNLSTKSHSSILAKLQQNKKQVKTLKDTFHSCKKLIDQDSLHLSTIWKLSNQYEEINSLIDCITWLKSVPLQLEKHLGKVNFENISKHEQLDKNKQPDKHKKYYLHASVLLASAGILLTSEYPTISKTSDDYIVSLSRNAIKSSFENSAVVNPFEKIPATSSLRSYLLFLRNNFHEILLRQLSKIIYNDESNQITKEGITSANCTPFCFENTTSEDWPSLDKILQREEVFSNGESFIVEKITEEVDKNAVFSIPTQILILIESFFIIDKLSFASAEIARKSITEFRQVLNESFNIVQTYYSKGGVAIKSGFIGLPNHQTNLQQQAIEQKLISPFIRSNSTQVNHHNKYEKEEVLVRKSSHPGVVLLNLIFKKFLDILNRQIFFSKLLNHRISPIETKSQTIQGENQISRLYYYPKSSLSSPELSSPSFSPAIRKYNNNNNNDNEPENYNQFKLDEMWELMQSEIIGLLRIHLQGSKIKGEDNNSSSSNQTYMIEYNKLSKVFTFSDCEASKYLEGNKDLDNMNLAEDNNSPLYLYFSPSVYNIAPFYLPLLKFNQIGVSLLSSEGNTMRMLEEHSNQFLKTSFFPKLADDFSFFFGSISELSNWSSEIDHSSSFQKPIFRSFKRALEKLIELFKFAIELPNKTEELLEIFSNSVTCFHSEILSQLTSKTEETISKAKLQNDELFNHIMQYLPLFLTAPSVIKENSTNSSLQGNYNEMCNQFNSKEFDIERTVFESLQQKFKNFDPQFYSPYFDKRVFMFLCNMINSLDYFIKEIAEYAKITEKIIKENMVNLHFIFGDLKGKKKDKQMKRHFELYTHVSKLIPQFERTYFHCIFLVRSEIRLFCYNPISFSHSSLCSSFYYFMKKGDEIEDHEKSSTKALRLIDELAENLIATEEMISPYLSTAVLDFFFSSIAPLLQIICERSGESKLFSKQAILALRQSLPHTFVDN